MIALGSSFFLNLFFIFARSSVSNQIRNPLMELRNRQLQINEATEIPESLINANANATRAPRQLSIQYIGLTEQNPSNDFNPYVDSTVRAWQACKPYRQV